MRYVKELEIEALVDEFSQKNIGTKNLLLVSTFLVDSVSELILCTKDTSFYPKLIEILNVAISDNDKRFQKALMIMNNFADTHNLKHQVSKILPILEKLHVLISHKLEDVIPCLQINENEKTEFVDMVRKIAKTHCAMLENRFENEKVVALLYKKIIQEGAQTRRGQPVKIEDRESYKIFTKALKNS